MRRCLNVCLLTEWGSSAAYAYEDVCVRGTLHTAVDATHVETMHIVEAFNFTCIHACSDVTQKLDHLHRQCISLQDNSARRIQRIKHVDTCATTMNSSTSHLPP